VAYGGTGQTSYVDGQLLIGNSAGSLSAATLSPGAGINIANGDGSITITNTTVGAPGSWHLLFTNALTPTSSTAGIFVNASSTFDSSLRVNNTLTINQGSASNNGLVINAIGSATANLFELRNSSGNFLSAFTASGGLLLNIASTTALEIQSGSGDSVLTVNTGSGSNSNSTTTAIGYFRVATSTAALADGFTTLFADGVSGSVTIGSTTNGLTFNPTSGTTYSGSARPGRRITLTPEYPGAVLTATSTTNVFGTMTSDFCEQAVHADIPDTNTGSCESGQIHNYYNWTTSQSGNQYYSVWVRWRVPDNWAAWDTNPIQVYGRRSDATNGSVLAFVYDTAGALNNSGGTEIAGTANTWTQTAISLSGGTWTAGSYITIRIDMKADSGDNVKVGEININYLSSN